MKNFLLLNVVFLSILNSCSPPSIENVTINSNYTMNYDYFAYQYNGIYYDAYWPKLEINNSSNSEATITFRYSFYVCGYRQTSAGLNKTVSHFSPKGKSYWLMNESDSIVIPSDATCGNDYITVSDVDLDWTVLSVY